jgi:hypothetical protein
MNHPFVVGQRVVCVIDRFQTYQFNLGRGTLSKTDLDPTPAKGEVVQITKISTEPILIQYIKDDVVLSLKEYPKSLFPAMYFRPLQERPTETSIEVFKKLLIPTKLTEQV